MDKKIVTNGTCYNCGQFVTKKAAKSHIDKCLGLAETATKDAFLIKVQWPNKNSLYWLYLIVPFKATLEDLDELLRKTWLECCGHLSQFIINRLMFSSCFDMEEMLPNEQSMSISCGKVLKVGLKFSHEYDFGSTTELFLEVIELIKSKDPKKISIAMRNQEPEFQCASCEKKAVISTAYDEEFLCKSCAGDDEFILPIVNSPRTGVCGYTGEVQEYEAGDTQCKQSIESAKKDYFVPISFQDELSDRADAFLSRVLPNVSWRFCVDARGKFIYIRRFMQDGTLQNMGRLTYVPGSEKMDFALYRCSTEKYDVKGKFSGSHHLNGTLEGALKALIEAYP